MSHSLGIFTATFLYAIAALAGVDRDGSGRVPSVSVWLVVALLLASVAMFISLIHRYWPAASQPHVDSHGRPGTEGDHHPLSVSETARRYQWIGRVSNLALRAVAHSFRPNLARSRRDVDALVA